MKNKFVFITLVICLDASAQVKGCFEQIYYFEEGHTFSMGPLVQLQHASSLYAEMRYNYEEAKTVSVYVGKTFLGEGAFSYTLTPIAGGVVGKYNGWSAGLNSDVAYRNFYFSAQSQYTFSAEEDADNYYFSWAELGYQPLNWFYGGMALQETYMPQTEENLTHPGFVVGFTYKKWTLPVYGFKTGKDTQAFVCSLIFEW